MQNLWWIGLGGFLGAISRYGLSGLVHRVFGPGFPWGTLLVNTTGSLLIGLIIGLSEQRFVFSGTTRAFLTIGFLGAFTTFSTFSFESVMLMRQGQWLSAFGNVSLNVMLCLGAAWLGLVLSRIF